jgi:hypothetical protein
MYEQVSFGDFRDRFRSAGRSDTFSYEGARALFDYLEQLEEDTGESIELDVIALCCEYSEDKIETVLKEYGLESLACLEGETTVIWEDGERVLYRVF